MPEISPKTARTYERIYAVVGQIPAGRVASYGQIAAIVGECTPRMVGYAMAAVPDESDVPWQRVINSQGKISLRRSGGGIRQRRILEEENVRFDAGDRIDLKKFGWSGPDPDWLEQHGLGLTRG